MSANRLILALPAFMLVAACNAEPATDVVQTNSGNIILNGAQADYSFTNDEIANTLADDMNAMQGDNVVMTNGTYGSVTSAPDNAM